MLKGGLELSGITGTVWRVKWLGGSTAGQGGRRHIFPTGGEFLSTHGVSARRWTCVVFGGVKILTPVKTTSYNLRGVFAGRLWHNNCKGMGEMKRYGLTEDSAKQEFEV